MTTKTFLWLLLCLLAFGVGFGLGGCDARKKFKYTLSVSNIVVRAGVMPTNVAWAPPDFVMSSKTAVSNAAHGLPDGWSVVCDRKGRYAPRSPDGRVVDFQDHLLRTNYFEATVAAWRIKEIWDNPMPAVQFGTRAQWVDCDK